MTSIRAPRMRGGRGRSENGEAVQGNREECRSKRRKKKEKSGRRRKKKKMKNSRACIAAHSWYRRRRRRRRPVAMPNYITNPLPGHPIGLSVCPSNHPSMRAMLSSLHTLPCVGFMRLLCAAPAISRLVLFAWVCHIRWRRSARVPGERLRLGTRRGVLQGAVSGYDVAQRMPNGRSNWWSRHRRLYAAICLAHAAWRL